MSASRPPTAPSPGTPPGTPPAGRPITPDLEWREGDVPVARAFDDVYFSADGGLDETRHVFLRGTGIVSDTGDPVWAGRASFTIGETGFGTGLNVLAAWDAWRRDRERASAPQRLHIVSLEAYPLARADLARALSVWSALGDLPARLIEAYPDPQPGFHRLVLEDAGDGAQVVLTLMIGDVLAMLEALEGQVDCWFADGFSPAKNPEMWHPAVFRAMAARSAPGARLATFTVARSVREGLREAGFEAEKAPGFGRKRDMLTARLLKLAEPDQSAPWFYRARPKDAVQDVVVLGAGIAGAAMARALTERSLRPLIIDPLGMGAGASGNAQALVMPRLTLDATPAGRFHAEAFRFAAALYRDMGDDAGWRACGVLEPAFEEAEAQRHADLAAAGHLPETMLRLLSSDEVDDTAGISIGRPGLFYPTAGLVQPPALLANLLSNQPPVRTAGLKGLIEDGGSWRLDLEGGESLHAQAVILCLGTAAAPYLGGAHIPLGASRGQIIRFRTTKALAPLRTALAFGPYIAPELEGAHVAGATYDKAALDTHAASLSPTKESSEKVLRDLAGGLGADLQQAEILEARASLRATTPDRLPLAGPVPEGHWYRQAYAGLTKGAKHGTHTDYPPAEQSAGYLRGLYLLGGLGSRGFVTAPLLADLLASEIVGEASPLETDLRACVHPARFLVRALKRGTLTRPQPEREN